jgi:hypothetical protein
MNEACTEALDKKKGRKGEKSESRQHEARTVVKIGKAGEYTT